RRKVEQTVRKMPLWKLQTVGSERLEFLYRNLDAGGTVRLEPGVAYCFRAFYPMITDMIEGAWSHFVQRRNPQLLGQVVDLRSFLFGSQRSSLAVYRPLLREVQRGRCFYCERDIRSRADVDHFIPWRLYSLDLGHNFVLAHQGCNSSKSDLLAAEEHLERWTVRNRTRRDELRDGFDGLKVLHDWPATRRIARWAYGQAHHAGGQVWVQSKELRPLSDDWRRILSAA
ncbi:MAG: HNH endonuclease, partial [Rhodospirillaceae bacterium]|nr:HNH endonuclease [Rhodospirillaceae bacterium]